MSAPDRAKDPGDAKEDTMSPHAVNSLVTDLVQMAQAMEKVPQLEGELASAHGEIGRLEQTVQSTRNDLDQARAYAASLEQRLHETEVAKDAAETMFLEADDRTTRALEFVKTMFGSAGSLIQALEPPRAEPVVEQTVETGPVTEREYADYIQAQPEPIVSEVKPIAADIVQVPDYIKDPVRDEDLHVAQPPQGQSEADPTAHAETSTALPQSPVAESGDVSLPSWATPTPPKPQPYVGKNYFEWPSYVNYNAWIAGGGTEWDYFNHRDTYKGEA